MRLRESMLTMAFNGSLTVSRLDAGHAHSPRIGTLMIGFFKRLWRDRRGNALVIAGAALPLVIGSAGLASDTIQWVLWKRQLQRAADSAAIAGVYAKMQSQTVSSAVDTDLNKNQNTGIALQSGYPQISYPSVTNANNVVKVALAVQRPLGFSGVFLSSAPIIKAEATAATVQTGVYCVVSLENTSATGIKATGTADVDLGCGMITNSTSLNAAIATGSSDVNATPIAAVGDIQESDNWNGAELLPFTVAEADPFANVNVPSFTGCQGNTNKLKISNPGDTVDRTSDAAGSIQCFSDMDINGTLKLGGATYIIDSGNVSFGSQARVSCTGCTIVLTNSNSGTSGVQIGTVTINATAQINMTAPTSGTFENILFYQDRRAQFSSSSQNKINGTSTSVMEGAFYFPNQILDINGTSDLHFTCAQFVARQVVFSGTGSINNSCSGGYDDPITGNHVRLVA
jgi:Flp pilus assembly protein TadG